MKKLFFALDKKLTIEMQHQTDAIFFEKYIQENLVLRGLRINLAPTFFDDEDFANSWVKILDHCSFELLKLLISKRNYLSEKATQEINLISFNLEKCNTHPDFSALKSKTLSNVHNGEFEFINRDKEQINAR